MKKRKDVKDRQPEIQVSKGKKKKKKEIKYEITVKFRNIN